MNTLRTLLILGLALTGGPLAFAGLTFAAPATDTTSEAQTWRQYAQRAAAPMHIEMEGNFQGATVTVQVRSPGRSTYIARPDTARTAVGTASYVVVIYAIPGSEVRVQTSGVTSPAPTVTVDIE